MVAQGTALTRPSPYRVTACPERAAPVCSGLDGSLRDACGEVVSPLSCWEQSGRHLELHWLGSSWPRWAASCRCILSDTLV